MSTGAGGDRHEVTAARLRCVLRMFLLAAIVLAASSCSLATSAGKALAPSGSCSVTPNPVPVGGQYTVNGTGLPKSTFVDVWATDSSGTQIWSSPTDLNGNLVPTSASASVSGAYSVKLTTVPGPPGEGIGSVDPSSSNTITLATCSFSTP